MSNCQEKTYEQRREEIATIALSGMLANPSLAELSLEVLVQRAIDAAELLLDKT